MSQLQKITDEQMDAVGVVSAPDVLTGTPSENKNVFDKMVRQLIAPAYNRAVDAIDAINQTESGIQAAEAVRVAAENGRVQAESSRAAAETQRSQAEQARTERESAREAAEQLRSTQETARVQAENSRISAEQERSLAESARASAEAARISAEQGRLSQEELRRQAEQERVSKEEARNAAESARATAESGRGESERERVSAETARTLAEQERVQAENRREDQETGYIAQAKDGALSAKSWAVGGTGTRAGEDTNNAQFWAQQAAGAAGGGVSSFNGRAGVVLPQSGDYTAEMVGADAAGSAEAVKKNLDAHTGNKNNPHAVTAAQVGADPAGSAAAVQTSLFAHTGNRNNPHSVTAQQVGADTAGSAEAVRSALASQIAALTTQLGGKAEIHTFSYVGTGTYGKNNKNSITADKPIVFAAILFRSGSDYDIALSDDADRNFMLGNALTTSHREGYGFGRQYNSGTSGTYPAGSKSADGKTFYWSWPNDTTTDRSQFQYNESGVTYYGFYIC